MYAETRDLNCGIQKNLFGIGITNSLTLTANVENVSGFVCLKDK